MEKPYRQYILFWAIASLAISILFALMYNQDPGVQVGFFTLFLAVMVGFPFGLVGAILGDALRRFAKPDMVFTTGGMFALLWQKLFWMAGPQLIGLVIGLAIGMSMVMPAKPSTVTDLSARPAQERIVAPAHERAVAPAQERTVGERVIASVSSFDAESALAAIEGISDLNVRNNLASISLVKYREGSGDGTVSETNDGSLYVSLFTVSENSMGTCSFKGRLDSQFSAREGNCVVTMTFSGGERFISTEDCYEMCGMGASMDGTFVLSSAIRVVPIIEEADGKVTYLPTVAK